MSVNIFGSSKQVSGGPGQKGQPGIGFKLLDNEGNFDIDSKRLAKVAQPVSGNDAVTKVYVDEAIINIKATLKRYSSRISRINSLVKDIPEDLDETKSKVDHLKTFCERMDKNIADIKEECVTREYFMNSMFVYSNRLTELENNNTRLSNIIKFLKKRVDEKLGVLSELEDKVNTTSETS